MDVGCFQWHVGFYHAQVVASCQEWKHAQKSKELLAALKRRLSDAVGPAFDAEDFQWPWFEMSGEHWDNHNRYEETWKHRLGIVYS